MLFIDPVVVIDPVVPINPVVYSDHVVPIDFADEIVSSPDSQLVLIK